jgi:hypothetical protein
VSDCSFKLPAKECGEGSVTFDVAAFNRDVQTLLAELRPPEGEGHQNVDRVRASAASHAG